MHFKKKKKKQTPGGVSQEETVSKTNAKHVLNCGRHGDALRVPFKEGLLTGQQSETALFYQPLQRVPQVKQRTLLKVKEQPTPDDQGRNTMAQSFWPNLGQLQLTVFAPSGDSQGPALQPNFSLYPFLLPPLPSPSAGVDPKDTPPKKPPSL